MGRLRIDQKHRGVKHQGMFRQEILGEGQRRQNDNLNQRHLKNGFILDNVFIRDQNYFKLATIQILY